jgi:tRNA(fMet)-specific endonuclease VapC
MQKFILDTDICIYWLKGNKYIEKNIVMHGPENVFITVVTECELYYGACKSARIENNLATVNALKGKIQTIHTDDRTALAYGEIKSYLEAKGQTLDDADLLIASITLSNNSTLVTNNTSHFKRIKSLDIINWK